MNYFTEKEGFLILRVEYNKKVSVVVFLIPSGREGASYL